MSGTHTTVGEGPAPSAMAPAASPPSHTVKIPPAFYDDHVARDLPAGTETHRTKKVVTVDLAPSELAELRSDAQHYADNAEELWQDHRGLVISARATLRALGNVTPPEPAKPKARAAKKDTEPKAKVEPKAKAGPITGTSEGKTISVTLPTPKVAAAAARFLSEHPKVARVTEETIVINTSDAQAFVDAITDHMRAIVAENRSANMYTEGKLRQIRSQVVDLSGATLPSRPARVTTPKEDATVRVEQMRLAKEEHKIMKAWKAAGEVGDPPATPNLDIINARHDAA